jgi:hypothetical protein
MLEREDRTCPFQRYPSATFATTCVTPFHSRRYRVPVAICDEVGRVLPAASSASRSNFVAVSPPSTCAWISHATRRPRSGWLMPCGTGVRQCSFQISSRDVRSRVPKVNTSTGVFDVVCAVSSRGASLAASPFLCGMTRACRTSDPVFFAHQRSTWPAGREVLWSGGMPSGDSFPFRRGFAWFETLQGQGHLAAFGPYQSLVRHKDLWPKWPERSSASKSVPPYLSSAHKSAGHPQFDSRRDCHKLRQLDVIFC